MPRTTSTLPDLTWLATPAKACVLELVQTFTAYFEVGMKLSIDSTGTPALPAAVTAGPIVSPLIGRIMIPLTC